MHLDIPQEPLHARIYRKMPQTKTADHTLCEPATTLWENLQEKCQGRGSLRNRDAAFGHFTKAILHENLQEKCRVPRSQPTLCASLGSGNALWPCHKSHFVRKFASKKLRTKPRPTLCASLGSQNALGHVTRDKSHFTQTFTGIKMPQTKTTAQTLCEPARSKCTWTCHKSHFARKFTGKMPQTSWSTLIKHRPLLLP